MDGWMDGWVGGWVGGCVDGRMGENIQEDYCRSKKELSNGYTRVHKRNKLQLEKKGIYINAKATQQKGQRVQKQPQQPIRVLLN